jgi:hypothetical protein
MPSDWVDRPHAGLEERTRRVPYVNRELRGLVWSDVEVRDVLLKAGGSSPAFRAVAAVFSAADTFGLLDLVTAMSLEAEVRAESEAA